MEDCVNYRELISAYIDDELKGKELKDLLLHLEGCFECKKELGKLLTLREFVRKEFELNLGILPTQDFTSQVLQKIEEKDNVEVKQPPLLDFFLNSLTRQVKITACVCTSVLIITFGIWFFKAKEKHIDNFLNIYELKSTKKNSSYIPSLEKEEELRRIVFYHLKQTKASTLELNPGAVEYVAYTSGYEK